MSIKTNCQMYNEDKKNCAGLNKLYCKFEECKFYKKNKKKGQKNESGIQLSVKKR